MREAEVNKEPTLIRVESLEWHKVKLNFVSLRLIY